MIHSAPPIQRHPPTKLPSHKPPEFRKSQLHRQYTSLLRSSPLILLFQHNNLKATELMGIRRELASALRKVDAQRLEANPDSHDQYAENIKLQIIQTGLFAAALRIVEFYHPEDAAAAAKPATASDSATQSSAEIPHTAPTRDDPTYTHYNSQHAYEVAQKRSRKLKHGLEPLLSGPLALVTFPAVSPAHLAAALSILSPSKTFPAPRRRVKPSYHEPTVQSGIQKLMLLGARVEGRVFDFEGAKWVGGIEGGVDGLRGQLLNMLQGFGAQVTNALEGIGRGVYFTLESRRMDMDEKENPKKEGEGEAEGEKKDA